MLILASKSPRRKQLLEEYISKSFVIKTKEIDEAISYRYKPHKAVKDIAYRKGIDIASSSPNDIVLSADTIVTIDNKIIGKPKDEQDAYNILKMLSNRKHKVITGYSIFYNGRVISENVTSYVYFNKLSDDLINSYIKSKSPLDKAGAYGIQDNDKYPIIKKYKGSYTNIMGLPIESLKKRLNTLTKNKKA